MTSRYDCRVLTSAYAKRPEGVEHGWTEVHVTVRRAEVLVSSQFLDYPRGLTTHRQVRPEGVPPMHAALRGSISHEDFSRNRLRWATQDHRGTRFRSERVPPYCLRRRSVPDVDAAKSNSKPAIPAIVPPTNVSPSKRHVGPIPICTRAKGHDGRLAHPLLAYNSASFLDSFRATPGVRLGAHELFSLIGASIS
jgi:hypothetical protein